MPPNICHILNFYIFKLGSLGDYLGLKKILTKKKIYTFKSSYISLQKKSPGNYEIYLDLCRSARSNLDLILEKSDLLLDLNDFSQLNKKISH